MANLYVLDANVYIEAFQHYYAPDLAPGFWDHLEHLARNGTIYSPIEVLKELTERDDELARWAEGVADILFREPDDEVVRCFQRIANSVRRDYEPHHVEVFLGGADPWVIAHAWAKNDIVVTHERLRDVHWDRKRRKITTKVKIPNVCDMLGVRHMQVFDFLRSSNMRLRSHYPEV